MSILIIILISLNIIFWVSYQNILSTIIGISMIVVYMQKNPKTIRTMLCAVSIFSSFYYALIGSPMNAVIDLFGFISSLVGLVRIDLHHGGKAKTVVDNNAKETDEDIDTDYYGLN